MDKPTQFQLEIAQEVCQWLAAHYEETEPHARNTTTVFQTAADEMPAEDEIDI